MFSFSQKHNNSSDKQQPAAAFFPASGTVIAGSFFNPVVQRQPAGDDRQKLAADIESMKEDAAAINQSLEEGKKSLCELSLSLFSQAYTGGTQGAINGQTVNVLDTLIAYESSCGSLAHYITAKPALLSQGHYKMYRHQRSDDYHEQTSSYSAFDANEWHRAVKAYLPGSDRDEIAKIGGFYNRRNDTVNLPADSTFGNALHEATHRLSGEMFKGRLGHYLNEGVTQLFADMILSDIGLPPSTGHNYGPNLADARLLVAKAGGIDLVAQAYFQGSNAAIQQVLFLLHLIPTAQTVRIIHEDEILRAIRS